MQTLLKKTNHILIHDVRQSLDNLCALVQQGVSPHSGQCVICSRPADCLADGSKDDVVVFRWTCSTIHVHALACMQLSGHVGSMQIIIILPHPSARSAVV